MLHCEAWRKTHMKKIALACIAILGVLSLYAEPSATELVVRAQKGPSLLFTTLGDRL